MKATREYPRITITEKGALAIRRGHPWIYEGEVLTPVEELDNGILVDAVSEKGRYMGTGFLSKQSKIRIRLLSRDPNITYDREFFRRRLRYAIDYRHTVMGEDFPACRLVFGEADSLPGVTCDLYGDLLSVQVLSYGMEQRKEILYSELVSLLREDGIPVRGIFERNDVSVRSLEGLPVEKGWYEGLPHPQSPLTEITENGIIYHVDLENGQKTGFFLDQKYNRLALSRISRGRRVLDCFTHTGSFAMNAAMGGAEHVTAVDISEEACAMARRNILRNGLESKVDVQCRNIFDLLPELTEHRGEYDLIILDPPAFTKNRKTVQDARRGYKEINFRAMKALSRGGYLATCSCSHFMETSLFETMLKEAADDAGVRLRIMEKRQQSPDHPVVLGIPETDYLKFFLCQII